jgi:hypothetical protein
MHDTQRMLKARVHGRWVDVIRPGELANPPQALKCGVVDDFPLPIVDRDEAVDGAAKLVSSVWVGHDSTAWQATVKLE